MAGRLLAMAAVLALATLGAHAQAELAAYDLQINTARVWLTTMEQLQGVTKRLAAQNGSPPADLTVNITRTHSMQVEGYMLAPVSDAVADLAAAITGFQKEDMETAADGPFTQFPFGWSPSEVFYNVPELDDTNMKLDACAIAGILQGSISTWDDPALTALNPQASLPNEPITLVYLNLSMPITESLTAYLSAECPQGWPHGVVDNLGPVVEQLNSQEVVASKDVQGNWATVNNTLYSVCIGASAPVGLYTKEYPAAMQRADLKVADGSFAPPNGDLNATAVAQLAELAAARADWSFLNPRSPGRYPVIYWGLATLAANLTDEGARGLYVRDMAGYLLTPEGQRMVNETYENNLPDALMPAALAAWQSVEAAGLPDVKTGIPTPAAADAKPSPDGASTDASAPAPAPAKPASGSPLAVALSPAMMAAAALAATLVLA